MFFESSSINGLHFFLFLISSASFPLDSNNIISILDFHAGRRLNIEYMRFDINNGLTIMGSVDYLTL